MKQPPKQGRELTGSCEGVRRADLNYNLELGTIHNSPLLTDFLLETTLDWQCGFQPQQFVYGPVPITIRARTAKQQRMVMLVTPLADVVGRAWEQNRGWKMTHYRRLHISSIHWKSCIRELNFQDF